MIEAPGGRLRYPPVPRLHYPLPGRRRLAELQGDTIGSDPWALPNPLVLVLILVVTVLAVPVLLGRGLFLLLSARRRPPRMLSGLARLGAGSTIAVYAWGVLHLVQDETSSNDTCQRVVGPGLAGDVIGYDTSFVPLGFSCLVPGGGRYDVFVPGYVNPTVLGLLLLTLALVVMAIGADSTSAGHPPTPASKEV